MRKNGHAWVHVRTTSFSLIGNPATRCSKAVWAGGFASPSFDGYAQLD